MVEKIICIAIAFSCAIVFYSIGIYAKKLKKPMTFWSGSKIDASQITDVEEYNRENSIMWKLYSLWYVAAGSSAIWSSMAYLVLLTLSWTLGLGLLIWTYTRIYNKYKV